MLVLPTSYCIEVEEFYRFCNVGESRNIYQQWDRKECVEGVGKEFKVPVVIYIEIDLIYIERVGGGWPKRMEIEKKESK